MKPLKVTMSAFGSYADAAEVDFERIDHGIFLITGDTGAGKTTIFDAVSFALYGEMSGDKRDGSMMRSQYAKEETDTFVELLFSDKGEKYLVRRSPSYQRISRRKNKDGERTVITSGAKVSLIMPDGSEFPGRMNEINEKIREIVGVDKNQFSQIAMIAQGEYLKLLHASSKERKEIFGRIFNTGIYYRIQQKLKDRDRELYIRLKDNENLYFHEAGQVTAPEAEDLRETWEEVSLSPDGRGKEVLDCLLAVVKESRRAGKREQKELEVVISSLSELKNALIQAENVNRRLAERDAAGQRLSKLLEQEDFWRSEQERLKRAEAAEEVKTAEGACREQEEELNRSRERGENCKKELEALKQPLEEAKMRMKDAEDAFTREEPSLAAEIVRLTESMPVYHRYEDKKEEARRAVLHFQESDRVFAGLKKEKEEAKEKQRLLEEEEELLSDVGRLLAESSGKAEMLKERAGALKALSEDLRALERLRGEKEKKSLRVLKLQEHFEEKSRDYYSKYKSFISVQAGIIASDLKEGEPCPVCGSLEHPRKALLKAEDVTEEQVDAAGQAREQAERELREAAKEQQILNTRLEEAYKQAGEKYEKLLGGTLTEAGKPAEEISSSAGEVLCEAEKCQKHLLEELAIKSDLERKNALREQHRKELEALSKQLKALELRIEEQGNLRNRAELARQKAELELQRLKEGLFWETESEAEKELKRLTERKLSLEAAKELAAESLESIKNVITEKKAYLASEQENTASLEEKQLAGRKKWEELIEKQGFAAVEEYRAAVLKQEERETLAVKSGNYEKELLEAKTICSQYRRMTEGETRIEPEKIQEKVEVLTEKRKVLMDKSGAAAAVRGRNEAALKNIKRLLKERETLKEEKQLIETLYTTADGKVNKSVRIDFQTYVQRQYFKQMISAANKRLLYMTDGQLLLQCRELNALSRQGEAGLDLDVYSMASGRTRDVKTLSGGESFMAALSMALGMADVIQNAAGRVSIDAMFIDEGFGSLDEDSRMKSIRILKELAGGRRMVAIISHVTELKEQIERKLVVKKSEKGSTVRWETGE